MRSVFVSAVRWRFRAVVARQQRWTSIHEAVLLCLVRKRASMQSLSEELAIDHQVLTATISRLMRAGLIELVFDSGSGLFGATGAGADLIASGTEPRVDEEARPRPVSAVFLPGTGNVIRTRDVRFVPLRDERLNNALLVPLDRPLTNRNQMEAIFDHLTEAVILRPNEVVRSIDPRSIDIREGYVEVRDETLPNLPKRDAVKIAKMVKAKRAGNNVTNISVVDKSELVLPPHTIRWRAEDVVIGGSSHKELLDRIVGTARERVIILSTFVNTQNVDAIWPMFEDAAARGTTVDLLYGVAGEDAEKHTAQARELAHRATSSRFPTRIRMHTQSVASHAKLLIADDGEGGYVAVIGSCNWLSAPFRAVEMSVVLRHPALVAQIAAIARKIFSGVALPNDLVSFLGTLIRWGDAVACIASRPDTNECTVRLVLANQHDRIVRKAAAESKHRLIVGSHRFGSTAEQAMLVAAANAAKHVDDMRVLYTLIRKPQFRSDVTALRNEYEPRGVKFVHLDTQKKRTPIHGKFLIWDSDDTVVTSLNWASAAVDNDDQTSEIGVHLSGPGVADSVLANLEILVPQIDGDFRTKSNN